MLTNAVWTAILSGKPVADTGVYFVFQSPDWSRLPDNLVSRANRAGIHTVAFFSDQFTTHVGSDAPFQEDRSGPRGWMQAGTAAVKDASLFLPVILPHLPQLPGATPSNQSGTYAYSLRRELAEILASGRPDRRTLAIGHLDYLHQPRFPGYSELSWTERRRVLSSPVWALEDASMNWQYSDDARGRPVPLYRHKLAALQRALADTVKATGFLAPGAGNALVVLSDHGLRSGVTNDAFADARFHRVLLVTFGLPARDPQRPISTIDVGALLGLASGPPAAPEVAYVNVLGDEWFALRSGSRLLRDGAVRLDGSVLAAIGKRLLTYAPYAAAPAYHATPCAPAAERDGRPEIPSGDTLALDRGPTASAPAGSPGT